MCPDTQASFSCLYDLAAMAAVVVVVEVVDVSVMSLSLRSGRLVWSELWGTDRPALPPSDQRPRLFTCTVTDFPCVPDPSLASSGTMTMRLPRRDGLTKWRVSPAAVVGVFSLAQECSQEARFCLIRYNVESLAEWPECIQLFLAGLLWVGGHVSIPCLRRVSLPAGGLRKDAPAKCTRGESLVCSSSLLHVGRCPS
jgi:hypothetical protein